MNSPEKAHLYSIKVSPRYATRSTLQLGMCAYGISGFVHISSFAGLFIAGNLFSDTLLLQMQSGESSVASKANVEQKIVNEIELTAYEPEQKRVDDSVVEIASPLTTEFAKEQTLESSIILDSNQPSLPDLVQQVENSIKNALQRIKPEPVELEPIDEPIPELITKPPTEVAQIPQPASLPSVDAPEVQGAKFDEPPQQMPTNRPPSYPAAARQFQQEGRVVIRALIDAYGNVARAQIQSSSGHNVLDESAMDAIIKWRFLPAKLYGVPVEAEILIPIRFAIKSI